MIHQHRTGRTHYDLRIVQDGILRSWSLLKELPHRDGERRLAVERENFPLEAMGAQRLEEEAFGQGRVLAWDEGPVELQMLSSVNIMLTFRGKKVTGTYQLRRMGWYPGNRWMLTKVKTPLRADVKRQTEEAP